MIETLEGAARWYIRTTVGDADEVQAQISSMGAGEPEEVLDRLTESCARRAAGRAFVTGLFGSPWTAVPLSLMDMEGATSAQATLAAAMGVMRDPEFFEAEDWDREVLYSVLQIETSAHSASVFGASVLRRLALGQLKKSTLRLASNAMPSVLGELAGAGLEYASVKRAGSRLRASLEERSADIPAPTAVVRQERLRVAEPASKLADQLA